MSFDQNMIIDATTGSIARFVNHSCTPNSSMVKWIVSGQPRMALFADRDIMTGEELTYDYNFDPFSAKNVQKCLCGSKNCRGVLGPKPKEIKPPKPSKEELIRMAKMEKKTIARKRKLSEKEDLDETDTPEGLAAKKRRFKYPAGMKTKAKTNTTLKTATKVKTATKRAVKVIKQSVSTVSVNAKTALAGDDGATGAKKTAAVKKSKLVVKRYGKTKSTITKTGPKKLTKTGRVAPRKNAKAVPATSKKVTTAKSSFSIVAGTEEETLASPKAKSPLKLKSGKNSAAASPSPRKAFDMQRIEARASALARAE